MGEFKAPAAQQNKTATPVQAPKEASSLGETEYVDSRASTFQFIQLQAAADDRGKGNRITQLQSKSAQFTRFSRIAQLQAKRDSQISSTQSPVVQREENKTGLPDGLKSGMEAISGLSLNDVKVHRNSDKPAQLQANAYAQGTDIHLAPGQEKHLPHELGHVVQQKEGRVKPTVQLKGKVSINDDSGLEKEADVLGQKAQQVGINTKFASEKGVAQRIGKADLLQLNPINPPQAATPASNSPNTDRFKRNEKIELESGPKTFGQKALGGGAESATNQVATAGDMNDLAGNSFGKIQGTFGFEAPKYGSEEDTDDNVLSDFKLNEEAQFISGAVSQSLVGIYDLVEKGKAAMEDKKDVATWTDFLLSAASAGNTALDILAKYKVIGEIPILGSAIEAAKLGLEIFRNHKAIKLLNDTDLATKEEKVLTEEDKEDKKVLNRYISKIKVDLTSSSFDFILTLGEIAGGFFPPADKFISIAKGTKGLFEKGYRAWQAYKAEKEQQALARLNLDEEQLSSANKEDLKNLSEKMGQDGDTPSLGDGSETTVFSLVQLQIEYNSKQKEAELASEPDKDQKKFEADLAKTKLKDSINTYNSTVASTGLGRKTISENDIVEIQIFHEDTIKSIINQVNTEISLWNSFRRGMSFFSNKVLTDKDKILSAVWKGQQLPNESLVQELSKGKDAGYFWGKTKVAMEKASKDREHFTKEELGDRLKKILIDKYNMNEEQLKPIFGDFADVTTSRNSTP